MPSHPTAQIRFGGAPVDKPGIGLVGPHVSQASEAKYFRDGMPKTPEALSQMVVTSEPKPAPIPLIVPSTQHVLCVKSDPVSLVVKEVDGLFERHEVDTVYSSVKFKWKCATYSNQRETRFVCKLYSVPQEPNYFVLDFERRCGDAFQFQSIYRSLNNELLKSGFLVKCDRNKQAEECTPMKTFKPLALPEDYTMEEDDEESKVEAKDFEPLCQMCLSPYIDVQREGLAALSTQLQMSQEAQVVLAPFGSKLMQAVAGSRDSQVRRLAVTCIACITKSALVPLRPEEIQLVTNLVLNDLESAETRRQSLGIILNLCGKDSRRVRDAVLSIRNANIIAKDGRMNELLSSLQHVTV